MKHQLLARIEIKTRSGWVGPCLAAHRAGKHQFALGMSHAMTISNIDTPHWSERIPEDHIFWFTLQGWHKVQERFEAVILKYPKEEVRIRFRLSDSNTRVCRDGDQVLCKRRKVDVPRSLKSAKKG